MAGWLSIHLSLRPVFLSCMIVKRNRFINLGDLRVSYVRSRSFAMVTDFRSMITLNKRFTQPKVSASFHRELALVRLVALAAVAGLLLRADRFTLDEVVAE